MELKTKHYIGIVLALVVLILNFVFLFNFLPPEIGPKHWSFNPILLIGFLIGSLPFILDFFTENKKQKEYELQFLEFVRTLVESVRSGVTIPQAIVNTSNVTFGSLTPFIKKLANQIEWGYPLHEALTIFAEDTKNSVIKRSVSIVIQAERSGGDMGSVLEAVTQSVFEIKKVKEERKSNAYTQTIQGYIIFFVFIAIMIILQIFLLPQITKIGGEIQQGLGSVSGGFAAGAGGSDLNLGLIFIITILVQGLFTGLMIGKFADNDFKSGLKHSLIMMIGGYLLMSTAAGIFSLFFFIPSKMLFNKIEKP